MRAVMRSGKVFLAIALGALSGACGAPFHVQAPSGFVELEEQASYGYAWRATTAEGVVLAVRVIEDEERGNLAFWENAITLQLRNALGYALLNSEPRTSPNGALGRRLVFGHDQDGKPYLYELTFYLAQGRLFVIEAGGPKELIQKARADINVFLGHAEVYCPAFPAPVLASRTCGRW